MMMISDDCLVECKISDDSDEDERAGGEHRSTPHPPPPPEFRSKAPTPAPKPPTPPAAVPPSVTPTSTPTLTTAVSRDPHGINKHLQLDVSDILAEPAAPRSLDKVWSYSIAAFQEARFWTYLLLTTLLAVPMAFLCGLFLAVLAALHVWFVVPCVQLSNTFLPCLTSVWTCAVDDVISPLCSSLALCCSQIAISLSNKDWRPVKDKDAALV
ncbi:caveolin-2 [Cynoglossus semilaevis]|uniref:Caveolin n=1 Tax=Cynoglossus semilaevis TaxID=244447 RepID=A0A3P8UNH1_CYNSE|nr:caveolin-2-like [Cynoglossus semilaevis]